MKLLDVRGVADLLGVSPKTIYDWVHRKRIPHYKVEGCVRFSIEEIEKWVESKKQRPYEGFQI